ncbi:MAG: hypothetical protein KF861_11355 [Planctomycetaceae bacterium]|nr:hypothetical protein [Planctomycetaceae bacterium]
MDKIYASKGFKRSPNMNYAPEAGKEKVVVYATKKPDGSIDTVTHGAIQDSQGTWESKLGQGPKIRHRSPDSISGPVYGEPVAVYEK